MSTEEARRHLKDLLEDRKILAHDISQLRAQLEAGARSAGKIRVRPPDSYAPTSEKDLQTVTQQHQ